MTRDEFDTCFAATENNTAGYTAAQLKAINREVWVAVHDLDRESYDTIDIVKNEFDCQFSKDWP